MKLRHLPGAIALAALFAPNIGCSTYHDDLVRGQRAYEENAHEKALAIFRAGENDFLRLTPEERARYAYLRGMTDFRVGYREDARHWLAIAAAWEEETPSALPKSWKARLGDTLSTLNAVVWKDGVSALSEEKGVDSDEQSAAPEPAALPKADAKAEPKKKPKPKPVKAAPEPDTE